MFYRFKKIWILFLEIKWAPGVQMFEIAEISMGMVIARSPQKGQAWGKTSFNGRGLCSLSAVC